MSEKRSTMAVPETIAAFAALGEDEKVCFLAALAHDLTMCARDTYEVGGNGFTNPERMRTLNEIQHRVLGFLAALLKEDPKRYSDEVLVRIVLEHPRDMVLQQQMSEAFDRALSLTRAAA